MIISGKQPFRRLKRSYKCGSSIWLVKDEDFQLIICSVKYFAALNILKTDLFNLFLWICLRFEQITILFLIENRSRGKKKTFESDKFEKLLSFYEIEDLSL